MKKKYSLHPALFFVLIISLLLAAGCSGDRNSAVTSTPEETAIPATATPGNPEILWVGSQDEVNSSAIAVINDFATTNSLEYHALDSITPTDLNPNVKIVVLANEPTNLSELVSAASSTQFIILQKTSISAPNLSTIQTRLEDEAFMAGYLTMLVADDWRAAGLLRSDSEIGASYEDAFTNGARYVCGKCNPYFAPIVEFPVVLSEPSGSAETVWANDAATLGQNWLSSVFIDPAAAFASVANGLSAYPINYESVTFIGTTDLPAGSVLTWDALLTSDSSSSLKLLLPKVLSGEGGLTMSAQIGLTSINEEIITPAKQDLFNEVAAELAAGEIIPTSIK